MKMVNALRMIGRIEIEKHKEILLHFVCSLLGVISEARLMTN